MRHMFSAHLLLAALFTALQGETLAHPVLYELRLRTTPNAMLAASPYALVPRFQLEQRVAIDEAAPYAVALRSLWVDEARRRQDTGEEEAKRFKPEDFFLHPPPHRHGRRHVQ